MSSLSLSHIAKRYADTAVLSDISLSVRSGEFLVIVGPSGCGKSTLLRLIAGLDQPDQGEIMIDGVRVNQASPRQRGIAMVFQSYALYPHMTVHKNMSFGLESGTLTRAQAKERVLKAAERLQLTPLLARKPAQLSGGQRQRVAIGRAIVREPSVFLFDEPLSNLDASLRTDMRAELAELQASMQATTVYVTHDQIEAMTLADTMVVLNQGRIEQIGSPMDIYREPVNTFVGQFIGSPKMNVVEATVLRQIPEGLQVDMQGVIVVIPDSGLLTGGETIYLGMRPQDLTIVGEGELDFLCIVRNIERLGGSVYLHVLLPSGLKMTLVDSGDFFTAKGRELVVKLPLSSLHVFDHHGVRLSVNSPKSTSDNTVV